MLLEATTTSMSWPIAAKLHTHPGIELAALMSMDGGVESARHRKGRRHETGGDTRQMEAGR